jgi:hypothetical protein
MSKIKEIIDKYFVKKTLIVGLIVLSSLGVYIAINQHSKLTQARAELNQSNLYIDIVEKEKSRLDSLSRAYTDIIKERDALIVVQDNKIKLGWKTIGLLQDSLKHTLTNTEEVSADSSYSYLNLRMPPVALLKYPFDSLQVKKIHYTFVERDGLFNINNKQASLITDLKLSSILKDSTIFDYRNLNGVYLAKLNIAQKESSAYKKESEGKDKVIKQQRFLKTILIPPAVVGVAAIIIKILAK